MKRSRLFQGHNLAVIEAKEVCDFRRELVRFAHSLDFETITAMLVLDQPRSSPEFYVVDNTPPAYLEAYYEPAFIGLDPVMQHCKRSSEPIVWSQRTYTDRNAGILWEQQSRHGYDAGIALALHFPGGKHFFLGVDVDRPLPAQQACSDNIANLKIFAAHAQETAAQIFAPHRDDRSLISPLSIAEIDILRWSMDGQSEREIAEITHMSEATVAALFQGAMLKLRCCTKYQAVVKAIRLALL